MRSALHPRPRLRLERLEARDVPSFGAVGPEFRVNTLTTGYQQSPQVAADADGNFVVVWFGDSGIGGNRAIFGQRYSAAGALLGQEFTISSTLGNEIFPAVAMDPDGDFVIAWEDFTRDDILARRFNTAGLPLGGEFRVSTSTIGLRNDPSVTMNAAGDFVITWSTFGVPGQQVHIFAKRFSAAGVALGTEFRVDTSPTLFSGARSAVAADPAGNFVVVWQSTCIYAQRYDAAGMPVGGGFRVNTTDSNQQGPAIAVAATGDFVITWDNQQDGSSTGVYAQRFSTTGTPLGGEFRVNTYTSGNQFEPTIAIDADGDFILAWNSPGQDGSGRGVFAQRFQADGSPLGQEFRVNSTTSHEQKAPSIAASADGDFVVTWASGMYDASATYDIYAQRYHANRPPTTSGLPNATIPTAPPTQVNLAPGFADADDGLAGLTFTVTGNTNAALYGSISINGATLTLTPAGGNGSAMLTVRATDPAGDFIETTFTATVGGAPPHVGGTQINGGSPQRSRVTNLAVTFDTQVTFAGTVGNAFTLTRTGGGTVNFSATASVIGGVTVVTLDNFTGPETESGSLRDGRYTLTAIASQISANGQQMAANYTFGDADGLFRFYGDVDGDGDVDTSDFAAFRSAFGTTSPTFDFDNDGDVDSTDFSEFRLRFGISV